MSPEITLPLSELKPILPGLGRVIPKTRTLPVLQSVRVRRASNGIVTLETTDLETHLTYHLKETQPGGAAEVLVPFDTLNKTAKSAGPTMTLIPEGLDKVRLRSYIGHNPVEQRLSTLTAKEWPEAPQVTAPAVPLDARFGATLKEALQCASDDDSRRVLQGACVDVSDPQAHYVVGTNGRILYAANSFTFPWAESVIIPHHKFLLWPGYLTEESCELAVQAASEKQGGWVQLRTSRWTFTTRPIDGVYPQWRTVLPAPHSRKTTLTLSPEASTQLLAVLPQLPGAAGMNSPVQLGLSAHGLVVSGETHSEATPIPIAGVTVAGPDITVALNRELLAQALRYGLNQVELETPDGVALFSEGGRKCVIKLLTPPAPPKAAEPAEPVPQPTNPPPVPLPVVTTTPALAPTKPQEPLKLALERLDVLRDTLKHTVRELGDMSEALKAVEKEKKAAAREVETVRATLRSLQRVAL